MYRLLADVIMSLMWWHHAHWAYIYISQRVAETREKSGRLWNILVLQKGRLLALVKQNRWLLLLLLLFVRELLALVKRNRLLLLLFFILCQIQSSLQYEYEASCWFIDSLATSMTTTDIFPSSISLIPPDIGGKQLELDTVSTLNRNKAIK